MSDIRIRSAEDIFEYLMRFVNVERGQKTAFKLDRMRTLCEALGHPEDAFQSIHVAGSKGKGSVSTMIASILEASGRPCGLYTSPHVISFKERIARSGGFFPEESYVRAGQTLVDAAERFGDGSFPGQEPPTYFELMTALAFLIYRDERLPWASIEVGLGGRLDSTNVITPRACALTTIELEHVEYLGDTLEKIAYEKAGIIKPGVPAVSHAQKPEVRKVFADAARERGSELLFIDEIAAIEDLSISRQGTSFALRFADRARFGEALRIELPMIGGVQAWNAALAVAALKLAAPGDAAITAETIRKGLANARLKARFELAKREGVDMAFDGAHTPESIRLLMESFDKLFPGKRALLFACAQDKRHDLIAKQLSGRFDRIFVTKPGTFKASDPEAARRSFVEAGAAPEYEPDTAKAARDAFAWCKANGATLLVTGSFYLCAEAERELLGEG